MRGLWCGWSIKKISGPCRDALRRMRPPLIHGNLLAPDTLAWQGWPAFPRAARGPRGKHENVSVYLRGQHNYRAILEHVQNATLLVSSGVQSSKRVAPARLNVVKSGHETELLGPRRWIVRILRIVGK